jgi:hypothetical protein
VVNSYKDWDEPEMGYRDRLEYDLESLALSHKQLVFNSTVPLTALMPLHHYRKCTH